MAAAQMAVQQTRPNNPEGQAKILPRPAAVARQPQGFAGLFSEEAITEKTPIPIFAADKARKARAAAKDAAAKKAKELEGARQVEDDSYVEDLARRLGVAVQRITKPMDPLAEPACI